MKRSLLSAILALLLLSSVFSGNIDSRNITFSAYKSPTGSQEIGNDTLRITITPSNSMTQVSQTTWAFQNIAQSYTQTLPFFTWELEGIKAKVTFSVSGPLTNSYNNTKRVHYTLTFSTTGSTTLEPWNGSNISLPYANGVYTGQIYFLLNTNNYKLVTYTDSITGDFERNDADSNFTASIDTSQNETSASITYTLSADPDSIKNGNRYYYPAQSTVLSSVTRTGSCTIKINEQSFQNNQFPGKFAASITITLEAL